MRSPERHRRTRTACCHDTCGESDACRSGPSARRRRWCGNICASTISGLTAGFSRHLPGKRAHLQRTKPPDSGDSGSSGGVFRSLTGGLSKSIGRYSNAPLSVSFYTCFNAGESDAAMGTSEIQNPWRYINGAKQSNVSSQSVLDRDNQHAATLKNLLPNILTSVIYPLAP